MTRQEYIDNILKMYSVVKLLADKNQCRVIHLRSKSLNRDMVLHSLPKSIKAFEVLCGIKAENLPLIYEVVDCDDGQIVLEEFIKGMTIAEVMETGKYRYKGIKKIMLGVCSALEILHGNSIVHRDIKPENIMISDDGRVVLIDFNASREIKISKSDTVVMGTVGYISPEQLGVAQSDSRTDIYALGVLLNVMSTGMHPSQQIAKGRIGRIVKKATSINPDDRFKDVLQFSEAL